MFHVQIEITDVYLIFVDTYLIRDSHEWLSAEDFTGDVRPKQ